ncbi:sigma-70 family RNA polymerase sigma factor [Antricoccus suffuscus]|uniref:sigma-70 family RNA polymerase sigma factor n=1 Tax=Antricoccus suffuscus TaxID=1629062 RepID=UPI001EDDB239|nr:sigma-70 family RNA polymerase sigma factor [Antricoccus suffuscus]
MTAWAIAAGNGDDHAMALFVRATQTDVWRLCSYLGSHGAADDLTQETYLRAFRSLSSFAARSSATTWLLSIARRVCADHVRSRRRTWRLNHHDSANGLDRADTLSGDFTTYAALRDLVDHLEPDRKAAFVLTQMLGASYAEAAEVCRCPVGTIRSRIARAREDLVAAVDVDTRLDIPTRRRIRSSNSA